MNPPLKSHFRQLLTTHGPTKQLLKTFPIFKYTRTGTRARTTQTQNVTHDTDTRHKFEHTHAQLARVGFKFAFPTTPDNKRAHATTHISCVFNTLFLKFRYFSQLNGRPCSSSNVADVFPDLILTQSQTV